MSDKFEIPHKFLNQLAEMSNGGFLLCIFDADRNMQIYSYAEDEGCKLALERKMQHHLDLADADLFEGDYEDED